MQFSRRLFLHWESMVKTFRSLHLLEDRPAFVSPMMCDSDVILIIIEDTPFIVIDFLCQAVSS
jgi:hypothetical protein